MAKTMTGVVSSDKGDKTIVVTIATRKTHPLYKKQYTVSKKFMAHDEKNEAKPGDKVTIAETKPLSARKRFTLVQINERATIRHEEAVTTEKSKDSKKKAETEDVTEETPKPKAAKAKAPAKKADKEAA